MKYSADNIIVNEHPELKKLPNGKWEQVWDIVLNQPISEKINLKDISQKLSNEDFEFDVHIQVTKGQYLKVCVTCIRDANPYHHDYSLFAVYKMFENIDRLLGSIDTIQGQKKDRWRPFRQRHKNS